MVVYSTYNAQQANDDCAPFNGLACTWQVTNENYRIRRGACARAVREAYASRKMRDGVALWPILADHKTELPFGWVASAEEREDGLYVTGYLDATVPETRKAFNAARNKRSNGLSLGFNVVAEHMEGAVRVIDELEIYEISVGQEPKDTNARLQVKEFTDLEHAVMRAIAGEKESEKTMANYRYVDDEFDDEERYSGRPLLGRVGGDEEDDTFTQERPYDPLEDPTIFYSSLRKQLREEDPELYTLTPGSKAFNRELEARRKAREKRMAEQRAELEAVRRARTEKDAAMNRDTFTPAVFAQIHGLDETWCKGFFTNWANSGRIAPLDTDTLEVSRKDLQFMVRNSSELLEGQLLKVARKRQQEGGR